MKYVVVFGLGIVACLLVAANWDMISAKASSVVSSAQSQAADQAVGALDGLKGKLQK